MGALDNVELEFVDTFDKAMAFKTWLGERRRVMGVDTETGGFTPHQDSLRLIQFGDLNKGWALPWDRWSGLAIETLNDYEGDIVLHNSQFDMRFITHHAGRYLNRWKWDKTIDTMTMAHILDPNRPKGLKPLASKYVDPKAMAMQQGLHSAMSDNKWTWATVPMEFPEYWIYAALDPVLTCHIFEHLDAQNPPQKLLDLEMGTLRVVSNMMLKGTRVDPDYIYGKRKELIDFAEQARRWLKDEYGIVNATSNPQIIRKFQELGIELPPKRTASGGQALDKEVLEQIDHPIATYVRGIKEAEKMVGTYFDNLEKNKDGNNRVHPTIWACGAITGRMTITDPALQTLPKKSGTVRNAFIPSEGNYLVSVDADQIEARLTAHFSQDPGMRDAFLSPEDFFTGLARQIFHDPGLQKSDKRRQLTKGVVYGKIYGAGVDTMARTAKVPVGDMQQTVTAFEAAFPGIKTFQAQVQQLGTMRARTEGRPYVVTPMGRKITTDPGHEFALTNYLVQGHASEILKTNLVKLDAVGLGDMMLLPIHDEIVLDVPKEEADEVRQLVGETMTDEENYYVPITWSGDIMEERWGDKYAD